MSLGDLETLRFSLALLYDIVEEVEGNIQDFPLFTGKHTEIKIQEISSKALWAALLTPSTGYLADLAPLVTQHVVSSDSDVCFSGSCSQAFLFGFVSHLLLPFLVAVTCLSNLSKHTNSHAILLSQRGEGAVVSLPLSITKKKHSNNSNNNNKTAVPGYLWTRVTIIFCAIGHAPKCDYSPSQFCSRERHKRIFCFHRQSPESDAANSRAPL